MRPSPYGNAARKLGLTTYGPGCMNGQCNLPIYVPAPPLGMGEGVIRGKREGTRGKRMEEGGGEESEEEKCLK